MKKLLALAVAAAVAPAFAADNVYVGADVGSTKIDSLGSKTGFGGFAGYEFTDNVAVEAGYRQLGKFSFLGAGVTYKQTHISAVLSTPLNKDISLYGRLGYNKISGNVSVANQSFKGDTSGGLFGVGLQYAVDKQIKLRAEFSRPASDATTFNVGVSYAF